MVEPHKEEQVERPVSEDAGRTVSLEVQLKKKGPRSAVWGENIMHVRGALQILLL